MKITKLESFTKPFVSFVKTTLEDGSQGFGQMSTYHADITAQIFHKQVAPWVLDKSWEDFNDIENLVLEKEHKFPGSYLLRAIAGLDTSLWDLKGKLENKPVTELIGGNTGSFRLWRKRVHNTSIKHRKKFQLGRKKLREKIKLTDIY